MTHLRLRVFGSFLRHLRDCMSPCSSNSDTLQYHRLDTCFQASCVNIMEDEPEVATSVTPVCPEINMDSDVVTLKTAVLILIGTKFDDFVQLPIDMQLTIVNEARTYACAMKATLFFSSATHNINVYKIFKFITAKLFNLPWHVERNLTIGEPIIDF
ncbi:hypothetical protein J5N97_011462 [Dioscorea zingiberensis]|uniref:Uncharacterized protein n=1 Tax=Dioscorea zingiberensis TaxID=325984 RepID=A0A9D5HPL4_9LILI|nr:hypothetical protein J5N97_011462 [Dioscorea zingiberensis]